MPPAYRIATACAADHAPHASLARGDPKGHEVGYDTFAINGRRSVPVVAVVATVPVAMMIVVAVAPIPVEAPLGMPEFARAPVIGREGTELGELGLGVGCGTEAS